MADGAPRACAPFPSKRHFNFCAANAYIKVEGTHIITCVTLSDDARTKIKPKSKAKRKPRKSPPKQTTRINKKDLSRTCHRDRDN